MNKKLFNILFLFVCILAVSACGQNSDDTETAKEYIINGNRIVIPHYFKHVEYREINDSLNFWINVNNFQIEKPDYSPENKTGMAIELRPLRAEFGESKYWTEKDRILETKPYNCKKYFFVEDKYRYCENGNDVHAVDWGHDLYTVYKNNQRHPITVIGCSHPTKFSTLQKICVVRAILSNNMQLEYSYKIEHLPRAFEIDYFVRQFVKSLIQPLEK